MAVPDTDTFTLLDVQTELGESITGLSDAYVKATGTFDPEYEGLKDMLSNFRNYVHLTEVLPPTGLNPTLITETSVIIEWVAPVIAPDSYNVYIDGGLIGNSPHPSLSFWETGLPRATAASWTVTSVRDGVESVHSVARTITTLRTEVVLYEFSFPVELWACNNPGGNTETFYHTGADDVPIVGDFILLTAQGPGAQLDGGNRWHRFVNVAPSTILLVANNGVITSIQQC